MLRQRLFRRLSVILAVGLLAVACSDQQSQPDELPFQDETSTGESVDTEEGPDEPDSAGSTATTQAEGTPVGEGLAGLDREPEIAACQNAVFESAGITEITDLVDFAEQSAKLDEAERQRLADCVNP